MLIAGFPSGSLEANCYLVAAAAGSDCVIIDPGQGATDRVVQLAGEHQLNPTAILLSHGHFDHVGSAAQLCSRFGIPVHIHAADRQMLDDPLSSVSGPLRQMLAAMDFPPAPDLITEITGSGPLDLAGLDLTADHVPGHTAGSVVYRFAAETERPEVLFTGDTLFAGSIGRSDLPGGDGPTLLNSIATQLLSRPDQAVVLPGHGPSTTIGAERASNPFLR